MPFVSSSLSVGEEGERKGTYGVIKISFNLLDQQASHSLDREPSSTNSEDSVSERRGKRGGEDEPVDTFAAIDVRS